MNTGAVADPTTTGEPGYMAQARAHASLRYQPEIDGLRTLAVLPVVLFHAGYSVFSGGYLGVDVFFVISGYLITSLLMRDISEGRFSLLTFYERRARRILPALAFVVLCCVPLAVTLLLPSAIAEFGQSVTATMGFYANHFFLETVDYFKPSAEGMPLLHMWSLAVEEQYYLLLPLVLWGLWALGLRHRTIFILMLIASVLSLVGAAMIVTRFQATAFYIFPTRAFELGIGSLLAVALHGRPRPETRANGPLAALGVAMILGSMMFLPKDALLPSWLSLVPCLGAALVILCATPGTATQRLLGARPMVTIGLFSFSLYLWHQPVFAFARAIDPHPTPLAMGLLSLLSVLLAFLTWRFVELTTRHVEMPRARVLTLALATIVVIGGLGQLLALEARRLHPLAAADQQFDVPAAERGAFVSTRYNRLPRDFAGATADQPRLLLIGDSHSQDFYNMALASGAFQGWAVATHYLATVCQSYFGAEDVGEFVDPGNRRRCAVKRDPATIDTVAREADLVIFVSRWRDWAAERLPDSIAALELGPETRTIVVGAKSFGEVFLPGMVGQPRADLLDLSTAPEAEEIAANATLRAGLPESTFVDIEAVVCPEGNCPLFTPDGELLTHDGVHLTEIGAGAIGPEVFQDPILRPYLTPAE